LGHAGLVQEETGQGYHTTVLYSYNRATDVETPTPEPRSLRFAQINTLKSYPRIASVLIAAEYIDFTRRHDETSSSDDSSYQDSVHNGEELAHAQET
jgi:hypothetical protein